MPVQFTINNCGECPHVRIERDYTSDSWEHAVKWLCSKKKKKKIAGYIEHKREEPKDVPSWCPPHEKTESEKS